MDKITFNPVNFLIGIGVGWFVMAAIQTFARSLFGGDWSAFVARALDVALFRDGTGAIVSVVCILVIGTIGTALFFRFYPAK